MFEFIDKNGNISANSATLIVVDKFGIIKKVSSGGGGPTGPAGGDLSGTYPNPSIIKDAVPTDGSTNAVESNGVFDALALKQNLPINEIKRNAEYFCPFIHNSTSVGIPFTTSNVSGGASSPGAVMLDTTQQPGLALSTGVNTNGAASIFLGNNNPPGSIKTSLGEIILETRVYIQTLSDVTNTYMFNFGLNSNGNTVSNNTIQFVYDPERMFGFGAGPVTPNWKTITNIAISRTITDTGIVVNTAQWYTLKIVINADATQVDFYIDNVLVSTHTTDIATPATNNFHFREGVLKSAGTSARRVNVKYTYFNINYTIPLPF